MATEAAANDFERLAGRLAGADLDLAEYRSLLPALERAFWAGTRDDSSLARYQRAFLEYEALLAKQGGDDRFGFIVVIPVADRPQHLAQCLASILNLCRCFGYGGQREGRYHKLRVLIADDSRQPENLARHAELAEEYSALGLDTEWFGPEQQIAQLRRLSLGQRGSLRRVLGAYVDPDPHDFGHKGAAITRNIAYLRLRELVREAGTARTLIQFIDSDQEFCVLVPDADGSRGLYAINYFHHLDQIFRHSDAAILTGKVVGDPPVSPAVMASNFLDDVIDFLDRQSGLEPAGECRFHRPVEHAGDAAYHDMADRFGFRQKQSAYRYRCRLQGKHGNGECLADFSGRLRRFFYGEHPTRVTYFDYQGSLSQTLPARTIYTGNYVLRAQCLDWFIPFASLKLRMAGPVLGRLLKTELGPRFVSANLPLLHQRTLDETGSSECRPGVARAAELVDLGGEFERQYFGDLMLFAMERLTDAGYPAAVPSDFDLLRLLNEVQSDLRETYRGKRTEVLTKLVASRELLEDQQTWWQDLRWAGPRQEIADFLASIEHNFRPDSPGWRQIESAEHRRQRIDQIAAAIRDYAADRSAWTEVIR